jgi:hypothetical protein
MPDLVAGFDDGTAAQAGQDAGREQFSIRDLTREFDVTARTLRFYEEKGCLSPSALARIVSIPAATARG